MAGSKAGGRSREPGAGEARAQGRTAAPPGLETHSLYPKALYQNLAVKIMKLAFSECCHVLEPGGLPVSLRENVKLHCKGMGESGLFCIRAWVCFIVVTSLTIPRCPTQLRRLEDHLASHRPCRGCCQELNNQLKLAQS